MRPSQSTDMQYHRHCLALKLHCSPQQMGETAVSHGWDAEAGSDSTVEHPFAPLSLPLPTVVQPAWSQDLPALPARGRGQKNPCPKSQGNSLTRSLVALRL